MSNTKIDKDVAVVLIQCGGKIYLMMNRKGDTLSIAGWSTVKEATAYFERGYNRNHKRSFEASMSACINWMHFTPSIVVFQTLQDLIDRLGIEEGSSEAVSLSSVAGSIYGLELDQDKAMPLWNSGNKPALIDNV